MIKKGSKRDKLGEKVTKKQSDKSFEKTLL